MGEYEIINEMLNRYNSGAITLDEQQKEMLAMQAHRLGLQFDVESQPFKKGLFDAADMALFGMLPNKWRPVSAGQELYGETGADRFAGAVGSVAGLGTGIYGAVKGAGKLAGMYKQSGGLKAAVARAKESEAAARAAGLASSVYNRGANVVAPAIRTASAGIGRAAGRVRQGVGSAAGRVGQRFPGAAATTADARAAIANRTRIMPQDIGIGGRRGFEGMFQQGGIVGYQKGGYVGNSTYFKDLVQKARNRSIA